jgi:hypothetical protein
LDPWQDFSNRVDQFMPTAEKNNPPRRLHPGRSLMRNRWIPFAVVLAIFAASVVGCSRASRYRDVPFEQPGVPVAARQSFCNGYLTRAALTSMLGDIQSVTELNRFSPGVMVGDCLFYDRKGLVLKINGEYLLSDEAVRGILSSAASEPGAILDGGAVAHPDRGAVYADVFLPRGGWAQIYVPQRSASPGALQAALRAVSLLPAVHLRKMKEASASDSPPTGTERPRRSR